MAVYLINIALIIILGIFFSNYKKGDVDLNKKKYCCIISLQWILISGLRGLSVGADTNGYKIMFDNVKYTKWNTIIDDFIKITFKGEEGKDAGYTVLEKIFHIFSGNYQIWLIFIAVLMMASISIWIYKKSVMPYMSYMIFTTLFYSFFAITGHRQTIAQSVAVFFGAFLIEKRKFIIYIIVVLLMSTIHKSCLVMIPFYFLYNKKITLRYIITIIVTTILAFIFKVQLLRFLASSSGYEGYDVYEGAGAYNFTIMLILVAALSLWKVNEVLTKHPEAVSAYNALFLSLIFVPLVFVNPSAMRVVQYFSVYIMLLVPYVIDSFDKKDQNIIVLAASAVLIFMLLRNNPQYEFFWNDSLNQLWGI